MELTTPLRCAVLITTHNRRSELVRTLTELRRLDPPPDEIIVCADGCSDSTPEMVRADYPHVRLIVHEIARGSIPSRNELANATACEIILSLDDDSYPVENDFIGRVRDLFAPLPKLAVAGFPQRSDEWPESLSRSDFGSSSYVGSFANSGAAIRSSVFRELGGYPDFFFHAYEEPDFALRCVAAGWQVQYETSLTIRHHFTPTERNELRTHHRHARNELWSVFLRCPAPQCFAIALFRIARQFGYAMSRGPGWAVREPQWWWNALAGLPRCLSQRRPLPWRTYLAWMQLVRSPIGTEKEWNERFGGSVA